MVSLRALTVFKRRLLINNASFDYLSEQLIASISIPEYSYFLMPLYIIRMVIRSAVVLNCNMSLAYALEADRHALCVCRHYMRATTLDIYSNHHCFSKYSQTMIRRTTYHV